MSLTAQFKQTKEGHIVYFGSNDDGTIPTFTVGRMNKSNKPYQKAIEKAFKPHQRSIQLKTMSEDKAGEILRDVFCAHILIGWENVKKADVSGNADDTGDAEFNKENAVQLLNNLPDLFDELNTAASDASNFRDGVMEEGAKN